ncbi:MAG: TonB-dependent receptor [Dysgonamonadaceae bacterium]|nr:TonB-dependent receptor [Dysgonamonadaceae bacterium]
MKQIDFFRSKRVNKLTSKQVSLSLTTRLLVYSSTCFLVYCFPAFQPVAAQTNDTLPAEKRYEVAYGVRTKTELTSAISVVGGEELARTPVSILNDAVQGKVSGLTAIRTTGSEPGWTTTQFLVRGIGTFGNGQTPLYMVDNVERNITQLDPEEIQSFTVLKDAAATVAYGMRAANGVINVTTKRGFAGKTQISFKAQAGMQQPTRLPQYLNSQEYVRYRNIALVNDGLPIPTDPRYNPDNYNGTQDPYLYPNTDWYDEFLKNASPQQIYKLSIAGGSEQARYFVLLGVTDQQGLFRFGNENSGYSTNYDYTRYNVRSNVDVDITKYLSVSLDLAGRLETKVAPNTSSSAIFTALSQFPPTMPVKNRDGSIAGTSVYTGNPYGLIAKSGYGNYMNRYLQGNVTLNQKLDFWLKGLSVNALFAFDNYKNYDRGKDRTFAVYSENTDGSYTKLGEDSEVGTNYSTWSSDFYLLLSGFAGLSYVNTFDQHSLGIDVKYLQSQRNVPDNELDYKNQGAFGRITYGFDKRYIVEWGWSYSGSENFTGERRFDFYPVGSLAWVVSNERFWGNRFSIDFLKLRGSYGLTGNSDVGIGRFPYESQYTRGGGYVFGSGFSDSDGSQEGRPGNPYIGAEHSLNANIGLDVEWSNGLFVLSADVFRNDRKQIITTRGNTFPGIAGQSLPYENIGSVLNRGFEVSLTHRNQIRDFAYYGQANLSYAADKITYTDEVSGIEPWLSSIGRSVYQQWGLQSAGFFNSQEEIDGWAKSTYGVVKPGDVKYIDQNNDQIINDDDRVPLGKPSIPQWNFGFLFGCSYKNLDFNFALTGVANRSIFISNNVLWGMQNNNKITATARDAWQQGVNETSALYPRLTTEANNHNYRESDIWQFSGNYIRLQNVEIGYRLPENLLQKVHIAGCRFFVNGFNLLSFDQLKKFNLSAEYPDAGVTAYPETRVFNIGINLKF